MYATGLRMSRWAFVSGSSESLTSGCGACSVNSLHLNYSLDIAISGFFREQYRFLFSPWVKSVLHVSFWLGLSSGPDFVENPPCLTEFYLIQCSLYVVFALVPMLPGHNSPVIPFLIAVTSECSYDYTDLPVLCACWFLCSSGNLFKVTSLRCLSTRLS